MLDGFAAQPGTLAGRDEFRGTGGSLYYLKHQDIMTGSERVRIEYRDKTSGLVAEAAGAADEQAADAREVLATVGRMSNLARQIASSISENATGAQEISAAAQKMNQLTHQMSEAVTEQKHGGEMVVKAVEAIAVVSRQNLVAVEQMSGAAKSLAGESDALKQRVSLLQV